MDLKRAEGIAEAFFEAVFPSNIYCISCGSVIDKTRPYALCDECMRKYRWANERTCKRCGRILSEDYRHDLCHQCMDFDVSFDRGYSCVQYGLNEKLPIMSLKYGGNAYIARKLARLMYDRIEGEDLQADLLVPVPMHKNKERQRGYNQAALLAKYVAKYGGLEWCPQVLRRTSKTKAMSKLNPAERRENLEGAFCLNERYREVIKGKTILLIDDIMTTGSTADACSRVLAEGGAEKVFLLVYASTANYFHSEEIKDEA